MADIVVVTGSRKWANRELLYATLDGWHELAGIASIAEGCAKGADRMAEDWAKEHGILIHHYEADWALMGKAAGAVRNSVMLRSEKPDVVLAFHEDIRNSAGTGDCVHKAGKLGIKVVLTTGKENDDD